jgi:hypothetical protein
LREVISDRHYSHIEAGLAVAIALQDAVSF